MSGIKIFTEHIPEIFYRVQNCDQLCVCKRYTVCFEPALLKQSPGCGQLPIDATLDSTASKVTKTEQRQSKSFRCTRRKTILWSKDISKAETHQQSLTLSFSTLVLDGTVISQRSVSYPKSSAAQIKCKNICSYFI